jgi:hypothetical protein
MRRVTSFATLVAGLAIAAGGLSGPASAESRYWSHCGSIDYGSGIFALKSHNVHCSIAKVVAKHYYKRGDHRLGDWRCRSHQADESLYFPVCKGNIPGQIVKFRTLVAPGLE